MEYGVLGPLVIHAPTGTVVVGGTRRRALLAALLAQHDRTVGLDDLVDVLWPDDPPPSARHSLHSHISRLRQELAVPVEAKDGGYVLPTEPGALDAARFDELVAAARRTSAGVAVPRLEEALALWRGPAFGAAADLPVVRGEARRLEERRLHARELLIAGLTEVGRAADAVTLAEGLVAEAPARETAWAALVRSLVAAGRPADGVEAYARATAALDELGLLPSQTLRAAQTEALGAPTSDPPPTLASTGAPGRTSSPGRTGADVPVVPSSLVGREADVTAANTLLDATRLVTLVGPGGVGKTRLALEVARRRADRHLSGARVVELTTITDPAAVATAVLAVLGVGTQGGPAEPALRRAGDLDLLVLLDNCEHVVDAVAEVLEHLLAGQRVRVLATSRERIGLAGEHVLVVDPLSTRGPDPLARRLFVERAVAAGVRGGADALDPDLVDRVVGLLDGLPLAIEMAAARTASLGLAELAAGLEAELDTELARLRDPRRRGDLRHRTLRAVIAWSEAVLGPAEHEVLVAWPVFAGAVAAHDARAVVGAAPEVVESLVQRSLLVLSPGSGRTGYRMLHTVRSAVQTGSGRDLSPVRRRHAEHFTAVAAAADADLRGPREGAAVARLAAAIAELRAAHSWAREHDPALAARLSRALHTFAVNTLDDEVLGWAAHLVPLLGPGQGVATAHLGVAARLVKAGELDAALRRADHAFEVAEDDVERLLALDVLTDAPIYDGRFEECRAAAARLADLALVVGDLHYLTAAAVSVGLTHAYAGERATARAELTRMRRLLPAHDDELAPTDLGWLHYAAGEIEVEEDPELAVRHLERAVVLADSVGNRYLGGVARVSATSVRARHGDPVAALPAFEDVIHRWLDRADRTHLVTTLRNLVDLLIRVAAHGPAAELWAAVRPDDVSLTFGPERERLDRAREVLAEHLPAADLATALTVGGARDLDEAALEALAAISTLRTGPGRD